jgi:hypothetical protein
MLRWSFLALAVLLTGAYLAPANPIAPPPLKDKDTAPPPKGAQEAKLVVVVDQTARKPRLQISQALLQQQGATPDPKPGRVSLPVVVAGLALSLGIVSGGFWLMRSRNGRRLAAFFLVASLLTFGATVLWADIAPRPRPERPLTLPAGVQLTEDILVEVVPARTATVKLILPGGSVLKPAVEERKPGEKD